MLATVLLGTPVSAQESVCVDTEGRMFVLRDHVPATRIITVHGPQGVISQTEVVD